MSPSAGDAKIIDQAMTLAMHKKFYNLRARSAKQKMQKSQTNDVS